MTLAAISQPDQVTNPAFPSSENPRHRTPPGHRVLHLVIPDETFIQLHRAAIDSGMRFSHYMKRYLKEAFPYSHPEHPQPTVTITSPGE